MLPLTYTKLLHTQEQEDTNPSDKNTNPSDEIMSDPTGNAPINNLSIPPRTPTQRSKHRSNTTPSSPNNTLKVIAMTQKNIQTKEPKTPHITLMIKWHTTQLSIT